MSPASITFFVSVILGATLIVVLGVFLVVGILSRVRSRLDDAFSTMGYNRKSNADELVKLNNRLTKAEQNYGGLEEQLEDVANEFEERVAKLGDVVEGKGTTEQVVKKVMEVVDDVLLTNRKDSDASLNKVRDLVDTVAEQINKINKDLDELMGVVATKASKVSVEATAPLINELVTMMDTKASINTVKDVVEQINKTVLKVGEVVNEVEEIKRSLEAAKECGAKSQDNPAQDVFKNLLTQDNIVRFLKTFTKN